MASWKRSFDGLVPAGDPVGNQALRQLPAQRLNAPIKHGSDIIKRP